MLKFVTGFLTAVVLTLSGCASYPENLGKVEGNLEIIIDPNNVKTYKRTYRSNVTQNPVKVWPELLQEGAKFGIDFSDPIFHTLDKPETVERKCIPFQESFLEKYKRQTICGLSEKTYRLSFSIFKKDMSEEDNLFLAFSGVSKRDASVNSQQVLEVVTNKNNALYYQAKKGDKLIETWTTFLIENEVTKKNEIKASVILRFNPGVKEDFILEKVNEYRSAVTSAIVVKN